MDDGHVSHVARELHVAQDESHALHTISLEGLKLLSGQLQLLLGYRISTIVQSAQSTHYTLYRTPTASKDWLVKPSLALRAPRLVTF